MYGVISPLKSVQRKLLDVRFCGDVVGYSIIVRLGRFDLLELLHKRLGIRHAIIIDSVKSF